MKRIALIIGLFLLITSLFTQVLANDKIALTLKARGDARIKRAIEKEFKPGLKIGTSIFSQDYLKTGRDGYIVLVFLDEKSQIKIRENSEMLISGERGEDAISKMISMDFGTLKAEISPQRKGEFIIATPTSVASVKGTIFWVISDPVAGDKFYGISGTVVVTNNESGAVVTVGANETGTSTPDGNLDVEETQEGEEPDDLEEEEEGTVPSNILKIELQNSQGDVKNIEIEYK